MAIVRQLRNRYFFVLDIVLLITAVYLSYVMRLETFDFDQFGSGFLLFSTLAIVVIPLVFYVFGIYARYWVYASVDEMMLLSAAITIGAAICAILGLVVVRLIPGVSLPRSIPFIFWPLALAMTAGSRYAVRLYAQYSRRRPEFARGVATTAQPVLVVGAGDTGMVIVRELLNNPALGMDIVGFVDDDPSKRSARILGIPVLGNRRAIPLLVKTYKVELVIIAIPTAPGREIREIVNICEQAGVPTKMMPALYELLDGSISVGQLRNVQIEDLLRREPVLTDTEGMRRLIAGKRVLVTGGGGSIGGELCRQILRCGPADLIVMGHGENSIFDICNELNRQIQTAVRANSALPRPMPLIHPVIADIRFLDRIRAVFQEYKPEIVFHAAAHKHVPLMEWNPIEAVSNNVLGTRNLLDVSVMTGVERFVMISTDKAVRPTSIMGASKRVAEMLVNCTAWEVGRPYVTVRFGNVLGSRGSVLQTFKQQIAAGGPITVTHPEMKRYFMTISEAVQLVLQSAVLGQGGEVFMLDMGEPVKIVDLARDLIELSGLEVGRDIDIAFTGIRPGEKLHEELFIPGESYRRTKHEKVFAIDGANEVMPSQISQAVRRLEESVYNNDTLTLLSALQDLLPEFRIADIATSGHRNEHIMNDAADSVAGHYAVPSPRPLDVTSD